MSSNYRNFSWIVSDQFIGKAKNVDTVEKEGLIKFVREQIVGRNEAFAGPFGERKITYCDWTASGRALQCVEDFIGQEVLTMYANTHTTTSATGVQSSLFRAEARNIVLHSVNGSKDDVALFAGTGCTGAVNKLVSILNIRDCVSKGKRVLVLTGPWEHHSNLLPWKEAGCEIQTISESGTGGIDVNALQTICKHAKNFDLKIGAFSAGSNVTGLLENTDEITSVLHEFGFLAFWDYAAAGPYVEIDMNPGNRSDAAKDAIFLSPHKFLGGPSTPGILVMKKELFHNARPQIPGGGTVFYVTGSDHFAYLDNFEEREEGGTQDIVGSVRSALAFQLKSAISSEFIFKQEQNFLQRAFQRWQSVENLHILGAPSRVEDRIAIVSFVISHRTGKFLHYNFIAALLNDLFGIQGRGGCMCAGPYAIELLKLQPIWKRIEECLLLKNEVLRPGFMRVSFHYSMTEEEVDFVIDAIAWVAKHGWRFLPSYGYYEDTGEWRHRKVFKRVPDRRSLGTITYKSGKMAFDSHHRVSDCDVKDYLLTCDQQLREAIGSYPSSMVNETQHLSKTEQNLVWFITPSEALRELRSGVLDFSGSYDVRGGLLQHIDSCVPACSQISPKPRRNFISSGKALKGMLAGAVLAGAVYLHQKKTPFSPLWGLPIAIGAYMLGSSAPTQNSHTPDAGKVQLIKDANSVPQIDESDLKLTETVCKNCFHRHSLARAECIFCNCTDYIPMKQKSQSKNQTTTKASKKQIKKAEKKLRRHIGRAIREFDMIHEGDRVLVALSGGKDSLSMLAILLKLQKVSPVKFEIGACTIDPMHPEYDPSPLIGYLKSIGVPYFYESEPIVKLANEHMGKNVSFCSFCSRMKRGKLYGVCRRENYNVLAMGQHADDLAESFLMSALFNGKLRTMKANYHVEDGTIRVIRPLVFAREREMREYADMVDLPVVNENCPACFDAPQERQRMKQVLATQEHIHGPTIFNNLLAAMEPLIKAENDNYIEEDNPCP